MDAYVCMDGARVCVCISIGCGRVNSDAFSQKFSKEPTLVNGFDNLYCMEVDNNVDIEQQLAQLQPGGTAAAAAQEMGSGMMQELLSSVPGIDEAMSFSELMKQVQAMNYSVVVFDTAPTGHTLRLLSIPRVMETAVSKALSFLVCALCLSTRPRRTEILWIAEPLFRHASIGRWERDQHH